MAENLLLTNIPTPERKRLAPYLELVSVDLQQELARMEAPIEFVWFPHDCVTSALVTSEEGPSLEVGLMGAEGMVGLSLLFGEKTSNTTVIGLTSSTP